MTALIDADSMIFIIAWNHKDTVNKQDVTDNCDEFIRCILGLVQADKYLGSFSSKKNFRHEHYKYAPYKGNRPPKEEWLTRWESTIKDHMVEEWGFIIPDDLEADDVISDVASRLYVDSNQFVICSPDKDLNQVPGYHFDYKKQEQGIIDISYEDAMKYFYTQLITGDTSDNIKGIKGMGPVKANSFIETIMKDNPNALLYEIQKLYRDIHGDYYGNKIFQETYNTIQLMKYGHAHCMNYSQQLYDIYATAIKDFDLNNISGVAGKDTMGNIFGQV